MVSLISESLLSIIVYAYFLLSWLVYTERHIIQLPIIYFPPRISFYQCFTKTIHHDTIWYIQFIIGMFNVISVSENLQVSLGILITTLFQYWMR